MCLHHSPLNSSIAHENVLSHRPCGHLLCADAHGLRQPRRRNGGVGLCAAALSRSELRLQAQRHEQCRLFGVQPAERTARPYLRKLLARCECDVCRQPTARTTILRRRRIRTRSATGHRRFTASPQRQRESAARLGGTLFRHGTPERIGATFAECDAQPPRHYGHFGIRGGAHRRRERGLCRRTRRRGGRTLPGDGARCALSRQSVEHAPRRGLDRRQRPAQRARKRRAAPGTQLHGARTPLGFGLRLLPILEALRRNGRTARAARQSHCALQCVRPRTTGADGISLRRCAGSVAHHPPRTLKSGGRACDVSLGGRTYHGQSRRRRAECAAFRLTSARGSLCAAIHAQR